MPSSERLQTDDTFWAGLLDAIHQAGDDSVLRRKAMHRLILHLQRSPNLVPSKHPDYAIALNLTWEWLNKKIGEFDISKSKIVNVSVEKALINWVNQYLRFRVKDLHQDDDNGKTRESNWESKRSLIELSGLEALIHQEQQKTEQRFSEEIQNWILTDPENRLKDCHLRGNPTCNCQILAQRLALNDPPDKVSSLAIEFDVKYQTLTTHWKRSCRRILQEQLQTFGYQPE